MESKVQTISQVKDGSVADTIKNAQPNPLPKLPSRSLSIVRLDNMDYIPDSAKNTDILYKEMRHLINEHTMPLDQIVQTRLIDAISAVKRQSQVLQNLLDKYPDDTKLDYDYVYISKNDTLEDDDLKCSDAEDDELEDDELEDDELEDDELEDDILDYSDLDHSELVKYNSKKEQIMRIHRLYHPYKDMNKILKETICNRAPILGFSTIMNFQTSSNHPYNIEDKEMTATWKRKFHKINKYKKRYKALIQQENKFSQWAEWHTKFEEAISTQYELMEKIHNQILSVKKDNERALQSILPQQIEFSNSSVKNKDGQHIKSTIDKIYEILQQKRFNNRVIVEGDGTQYPNHSFEGQWFYWKNKLSNLDALKAKCNNTKQLSEKVRSILHLEHLLQMFTMFIRATRKNQPVMIFADENHKTQTEAEIETRIKMDIAPPQPETSISKVIEWNLITELESYQQKYPDNTLVPQKIIDEYRSRLSKYQDQKNILIPQETIDNYQLRPNENNIINDSEERILEDLMSNLDVCKQNLINTINEEISNTSSKQGIMNLSTQFLEFDVQQTQPDPIDNINSSFRESKAQSLEQYWQRKEKQQMARIQKYKSPPRQHIYPEPLINTNDKLVAEGRDNLHNTIDTFKEIDYNKSLDTTEIPQAPTINTDNELSKEDHSYEEVTPYKKIMVQSYEQNINLVPRYNLSRKQYATCTAETSSHPPRTMNALQIKLQALQHAASQEK